MIKKNNQTIDKIYKGSTEIAKIYKGSTLVYENYRDIVATGNDIINITKAKAGSLNYLKAFGKCEQKRLPVGYTELESISGISSKAWFDTGIAGNNDNLRFVFSGYKGSGVTHTAFFGNYVDESSNITRLIAASGSSGIIAEVNRKAASSIPTNSVNYLVAHTYELYKENGVSILKVDGVQVDTIADSAGTANSTNIAICGSKINPSTPSSDVVTTFQGNFEIYDGTTLIRNYVMAKRDSDNAVGMYDIVNNTFKISEGTENFTAGPDLKPLPTYPLAITCNNGVLKFGKRLTLDSTRYYAYIYIDGAWKYSNDSYSIVVPVIVGHKYKITVPTTSPLNGLQNVIFRYGFADTINEDWKNDSPPTQTSIPLYDWTRSTPQNLPSVEATATHPYLIIQMSSIIFGYILTNNLITITDQTIYIDGTTETIKDSLNNTATCENLLSVGTYKDVQSILDGTVTRNIGVKVLTGNEDWAASSIANLYSLDGLNNYDSANFQNGVVFCTHFIGVLPTTSGTDMPNYSLRAGGASGSSVTVRRTIYIKYAGLSSVNDFKQWLATQYANGTPVIIVYPLATPTTETATAQPLNLQEGTNIIEITEASLDNLEVEVKYKGK